MAIMDLNNKIQSATPWGAIAGAAGSAIGALTANTRRKQQMRDQKKLMEIQQQNQMALNKQGQQLAQENWDYTNAENQVKHYENAGLNVGLMYGGSGSGGTLSSGSGGGAAGGSAPVSENAAGQIGMGLMQMQQIQSTTELNKALANKANAEAAKTSGIDTEIGGANKALIEMNTKNAEVQNQLNSRSLEDSLDTIKANRDTAVANSATASTQADVNATTKQAQIDEINAKAINEAFKLAVAKSGINLNEAQMNKMLEDVKIGKANAEKIGIDQVAGKQLNSLIEKIYDMFGVKNETIK
jgi:hypothetical protein